MRIRRLLVSLFAAFPCAGSSEAGAVAKENDGPALAYFEKHVRPVLVNRCYECHSLDGGKKKGGLLLDSREGWMKGGDSGPALLPGKPEESLLLTAVRYEDADLEMPPKGRLPAEEIRVLERWIEIGAPDPREDSAAVADGEKINIEEGRRFWAFRPPVLSAVPAVRDRAWPMTDIDNFVRSRQEAAGIAPVADAKPREWLRRLYFDLIGLPPSPGEMAAFLADDGKDRFARWVDDLLARPQFGEKWGRHWLDLARYADSTGGGRTFKVPNAWRYRDYVIDAYNGDLPYDVFVREQIAGDLLERPDAASRSKALIATGFLALGPKNLDLQDKELLLMNTVDEQIDTVGRVFLGMTLGCARCHDHKFDPVPTTDYYALAGIFRSTNTLVRANISTLVEAELPTVTEEARRLHADHTKAVSGLNDRLKKAKAVKPQTDESGAAVKELTQELARLKKQAPLPLPKALRVGEGKETGDWHVCVRGNVRKLGAKVPRGFLAVATPRDAGTLRVKKGESGRRDLAGWLGNEANPLTARVYVNRVWHHLFGSGIVRTVDNFGLRGEEPSHPQLLDFLALRFVQNGWSTKALVRELVLSHTYRLGSEDSVSAGAADAENRLRWRMPRRRLSAEALRDAMLSVGGGLELRAPAGLLPDDALHGSRHRSVYLPVFREEGSNALLQAFDFPDPSTSVGRRGVSTLPTQSLYLMNSPFVMAEARRAASALLEQLPNANEEQRLEHVYLATLGRPPMETERRLALDYLREVGESSNADKSESWARLVHSLFACVDFRYLN